MKKFMKSLIALLSVVGLASCSFSLAKEDLMEYCESINFEEVKERDYFEVSIYRTQLVEGETVYVVSEAVEAVSEEPESTPVVEEVSEKLDEAVAAAEAGSVLKLTKDIILEKQLTVEKDITIDLNGHELSNTSEIWNEAEKAWSLISVNGAETDVTLKNGTLVAKENDCYAVDVRGGARLTIDSGTYIGNISSVYVYEGHLTVNDGTFMIQQLDSINAYGYVLNCLDKNYAAGKASIDVRGGAFVGFNPESAAEVTLVENYAITSAPYEVTEVVSRLDMFFKPNEIFIGYDDVVEAANEYDEETLIKFSEKDSSYIEYKKEGSSKIDSELKTEEYYKTYREELLNIVLNDKYLPASEDDILSGETGFKGIADINITFKDAEGNFPVITLEKNSGSISLSYKLGKYFVKYQDKSTLTIEYKYPFEFMAREHNFFEEN